MTEQELIDALKAGTWKIVRYTGGLSLAHVEIKAVPQKTPGRIAAEKMFYAHPEQLERVQVAFANGYRCTATKHPHGFSPEQHAEHLRRLVADAIDAEREAAVKEFVGKMKEGVVKRGGTWAAGYTSYNVCYATANAMNIKLDD